MCWLASKVFGANERSPLRAPLTGWLITNSLTCQQCAMHASQGKRGDADNKVGGGFGQVTMGPGNIAILGTLAILADTYFGFNDQVGGRRAGISSLREVPLFPQGWSYSALDQLMVFGALEM